MKPIVYFDFKELNENEVVIGKQRLNEILEEVYQAGYSDGNNNHTHITSTPSPSNPGTYPIWRGDTYQVTNALLSQNSSSSHSDKIHPITC